jgi:small subunit ribosomal protein S9
VNDKPIEQYFSHPLCAHIYLKPFKVTNTLDAFSAQIRVSGGGLYSQLGAIVHGISRALLKYDETFKPVLRKYKLLTRDPRMKESRKYGHAQKARAKKSSPKR